MDQRPMAGADALALPSPDVAQAYLDEAQRVTERREPLVEHRTTGWLLIITSVLFGGWLSIWLVADHLGGSAAVVPCILVLSIWGQLEGGVAERFGVRAQLSLNQWPLLVTIVLGTGGALVSTIVLFMMRNDPPSLIVVPPAIILSTVGVLGVVQLIRAPRAGEGGTADRAALSLTRRRATLAMGGVLAFGVLAVGVPDGLVSALLVVLFTFAVTGWMFGYKTEWGYGSLGAVWRWPQWLAFAVGIVMLAAATVGAAREGGLPLPITLGFSVAVLTAFALSARADGREVAP